MAFDPTLPANNSPIVSAELRNQFNALQEQITALQAQVADFVSQLGDTSRNVSTIGEFNANFSNPPTQADLIAIQTFINQMVDTMTR